MDNLHKTKQNLFITGASGFLGSNLIRFLAPFCNLSLQYHQTDINYMAGEKLRIDLTSEKEVKTAASSGKFDFVVHLAALTSVDECEKDKSYASKINIEGTRNIINYFNDKNIPVLFISTDLVFDGTKGNYSENDPVNPVNYYSETKIMAENIVLGTMSENAIFRIALSYGKSFAGAKGGYLDNLLQSLAVAKQQYLFHDQFRTPLYSFDFCTAVKKLVERKIQRRAECQSKIYHIGGKEKVSRFELGIKTCEIFEIDNSLIKPSSMQHSGYTATRGADCSLNISLASKELDFQPESINDNLKKDKNIRKEELKNANLNSH